MAENENNQQRHEPKQKKEKLRMQDQPVAGWSIRKTVIVGIICVILIGGAIALMGLSGGFGYRSKNAGMVNNPDAQKKQEQMDSASASAGKQIKSVDSDNIKYSSTDIDKMGCETLAAMVLDKSKQKDDYSLRHFFYSRSLSGMRYQTNAYLASMPSKRVEEIDKKLAKALGIQLSTFMHNYTWLVATGHKGATYDGNRYGFDIYWANQGLTTEDAQTQVPAIYYNTKSQTYQKGTIKTTFLRQNEVSFDKSTFKASK